MLLSLKSVSRLTLLLILFAGLRLFAQDSLIEEEKREFVVAYSPREITLDPAHIYTTMESELSTALYEGLVSYHPFTMEPLPGVASHWEVSPDGLIYRFFLREDALFNNGDQVKAQDFKNTWLRAIDPQIKAEYSFLFDIIKGVREFRLGQKEIELGINVISDYILEVELEQPASHFLKLLCHLSFAPLHPHYLETENWGKDSSLVSNGPFYIIKKNEEELLLLKNKLYWDRNKVKLEQIRVRFIDDPAIITLEYNQGKIDWTNNWITAQLEDRDSIVFNPLFATSYFYFVCSDTPWNDERVRRGLALLLPWAEIRNEDLLFKTHRLIPPFSSYPDVAGITATDLKEGLSLLEQAGFPGGRGLPPLIIKVASDSESLRIAKQMAAAWGENTALEIEIKSYEYEKYLLEVKKDDYQLGSVTWIGDYADPLTFLQMWIKGSNLNDARFSDSEYEKIINQSMGEHSAARYEKLAQAEELLLNKAVVLPINHAPAFNLIDLKNIGGWYPNVLNIHPFKYIYFKEKSLPPGIVLISGSQLFQ